MNMTKKLVIALPTLAFGLIGVANASMYECGMDAVNHDLKSALKTCKPYVDSDKDAQKIYGLALSLDNQYSESVPYLKSVVSDTDKSISALGNYQLGNIYYFGLAEPKYAQDKKLGVKYFKVASDQGLEQATEILKQIKLLQSDNISRIAYSMITLKNDDPMKKCFDSDSKEQLNECKPFLKKSQDARYMYAKALFLEKDYIQAVPYIKEMMLSENIDVQSDGYQMMSNIYYFGEAQPKYPEDKTKGLAYLTKAADLGNDFAQSQLGDFYNSQGGDPDLNISQTYKWYTLSKANGRSLDFKDFQNNMKNQAPYCLAMGEQLVATAYLDGSAGLPKDEDKAKEYLSQAIALYKDNEPTKENLKYCPQQKGLDLESAEKQLGSL